MLDASTAFAAVVEGVSQNVVLRLLIDLPTAPYIGFDSTFTQALASINLDTNNQTELPDEVRDTTGFGTLGGQCVLAGPIGPFRKETVAWLFNPDETDSPLYRSQVKGAAVTFDVGVPIYGQLEPEFVRQFTGVIATLDIDHDDETVTLGLVDTTDAWGEVDAIPPPPGGGTPGTSKYVIDALMAQVGATDIAIIDDSFNPLTVVPEIEAGTTVLDELQTIAAAEFGYFRVDEYGVPRFSNRASIANAPLARTVTSTRSLKMGITTSIGGTTQYDAVQVPYTAWTPQPRAAVFNLGEVKTIPRHQKVTWTQPLDGLARAIDVSVLPLADGHDPDDGHSWYRASSDPDGIAEFPAGGLIWTITQITSATIKITVRNRRNADAYLTTPSNYTDLTAGAAGTGLWIGGTPLNPADEAFVTVPDGGDDEDDTDTPAPASTLTLESNPYWQFATAATAIGQHVRTQVSVPIRDYADTTVFPDWRIQVADLLLIQDPHRSKINEYVRVFGKHIDIELPPPGGDGGTLDMALDIRPLGPPGAWLLGIPGRSELGAETDGGTAYLYGPS